MNVHMSAHFPIVPIAVAAIGVVVLALTSKEPWHEVGRAALWSGMFAALLASS